MRELFKEHGIDISDNMLDKLKKYHELLVKWQKSINLVSNSTINDVVMRHFLDSVQLIKYIDNKDIKLVDMGSGAGFPALILAILGVKEVHLIESDTRKATFLRTVSRETKLNNVTIHNKRIENCDIEGVDLFTARALASLDKLFTMVKSIKGNNKELICLFLKGNKLEEEVAESKNNWVFNSDIYPSITDSSGKIIKITNLRFKE